MAAVRSEGGLLPADVLARIAELDSDLGGLAVADFHLAPNERLGEAIARSWARLTAAWEAFSEDRDLLQPGDHASKATRERWLLPLFSELGYGRLVQQPGVEIDGKSYPVFCEYNHSPVHLVGAGVPLDRRTAGVRGAADQSPHSLVQELLNRSEARLWGIVTNGLSLRLLRDNVTLTRQAYVEFDVEAIFATEAYEDFALLWLCAHQSRLEAEAPEDCWLERWTQAAQRDGIRALSDLRSGVERAIEALGRGFLAQPANSHLHDALRDGTLDGIAYYRELLRLIYRLLFVFVAEDRDALLLPDDGSPERFDARERYDAYYGTKRLRRLSVRRRGGRAHDLYEQVKLLSGWLHDGGQPVLALPPLGSALWDPATTANLAEARLGNEALLEAIRELAYVEGGHRPIDFRNLGAEELGSVYESLLELHPEIDRETAHFTLTTAGGHERKQTGSYYTPTSLIGSLLETALDPVIDVAGAADDPEQALLDLTVCDPACGSGHFLIAAANRIAKRLAAVRERDPEPAPEAIRHALRDVVSRCIHGVDVNPMAVELCKVSLWLEALEPGRPLSFLDDRILCGNSLLGVTPALVEGGIPDTAFKALLGDDKDIAKAWRQDNVRERKGQTTLRLHAARPAEDAATLSQLAVEQRAVADDSLDGVRARATAHDGLLASDEHARLRLAADAWVAAFTVAKKPTMTRITTGVVERAAQHGPAGLSAEETTQVRSEAERYRPLHWHIAFPAIFRAGDPSAGDLGWSGGFDCVLGNPPWERVKLQEQEFFAASSPDIADAKTKAVRDRLITKLVEDDPALHGAFIQAKRAAEAESHHLRTSGRYPLCGHGDVNTYAVFAELMLGLRSDGGFAGAVLPTGLVTDDTTKRFARHILEQGHLVTLYELNNSRQIFPAVAAVVRFMLVTLGPRRDGRPPAVCRFNLDTLDGVDQVSAVHLSARDVAIISPNTRTLPLFRNSTVAKLVLNIHERLPAMDDDVKGSPWQLRFAQMFHMAGDSHLFLDEDQADGTSLPLLEAKMINQYNDRFGTYAGVDGVRSRPSALRELEDPDFSVEPRYWVPAAEVHSWIDEAGLSRDWLLAWRGAAYPETNRRSMMAAIIPAVAVGHTSWLARTSDATHAASLLAILNSILFDFLLRVRMSNVHVNQFAVRQVAVPSPAMLGEYESEIRDLTCELTYVSHSTRGFAAQLRNGDPGPPVPWDPDLRAARRARLDAIMLHSAGLTLAEAATIFDTFDVLKRLEEAEFGHYRSKELALSALEAI